MGGSPLGRKAEDGLIDARSLLKETPSASYVQRTEWNVRDSDGTVVFSIAPVLTGGSKRTVDLAHKHGKLVLHLARDGGPETPRWPRAASSRLRIASEAHFDVASARSLSARSSTASASSNLPSRISGSASCMT